MKNLDEHNDESRRQYYLITSGAPRKNGIGCPICGEELWDSDPNSMLMSSPPQKRVNCDCGYTGYRVA